MRFLKIFCVSSLLCCWLNVVTGQNKLPSPLRYPDTTISDFGFGLDLKPTILPNGDILVHIALLGGGFYKCPFLGFDTDGALLYGRPVREEELSAKYGEAKVIYIDDKPAYFFTEKKTKRWRYVELATTDSLTVVKETQLMVGGNPLVGDFTIIKNREGTFMVKFSYTNEGKSYWPGGKNPWVYPPNPYIGHGKGYDEQGVWTGDKSTFKLSYAEAEDLKNWQFGKYKRVLSNDEHLAFETYQSPVVINAVEVLGKREKQILMTWDVDRISLFETGVINDGLNFFEKKLPKGISSPIENLYSGAYLSSTQPLYPEKRNKFGFVMGGNPGILMEYYWNDEEKAWAQRPVRMKGGDLHVQTLGAPHWVDWDGDDIPDIVAGDASGFIWFFKNSGTSDDAVWEPGVKLRSRDDIIQHQAGLTGSIQGPNEKRWGYIQPLVVDWDGDGLLDILCNDVKGEYTIYKNIGTKTNPVLDQPQRLQYKKSDYTGAWRSKPAVIPGSYRSGTISRPDDLLAISSSGILCIYKRENADPNVLREEIPIKWENGDSVRIVGFAGHEGRATLSVCDYNRDGKWDILFGQGIHMFQSKEVKEAKNYATAYIMINVGTNENPAFKRPQVICQQDGSSIDMDRHGCWVSPVFTKEGYVKDILAGGEDGRFYLFKNPLICPDMDGR